MRFFEAYNHFHYEKHDETLFLNDFRSSPNLNDFIECIFNDDNVNLSNKIQNSPKIDNFNPAHIHIIHYAFNYYHDAEYESFSLLDLSAYFGAIKAFKVLKLNDFRQSDCINQLAIAGGNLDIIHILVQEGFLFDYCMHISIIFCRPDLTEWLITNYKYYPIRLLECLFSCDLRSFLFLLLNGFTFDPVINCCEVITPEILSILYDNHINLNDLFINLCSEEITLEKFQLFLDYNIKIDYSKVLYNVCHSYNPIPGVVQFIVRKIPGYLDDLNENPLEIIGNRKIITENCLTIIEILTDKYRDINQCVNYLDGKYSPLILFVFIYQKKIYEYDSDKASELIKTLISKGADPDQVFKHHSKCFSRLMPFTLLSYLCTLYHPPYKMIKTLVEEGASLNLQHLNEQRLEKVVPPLISMCVNELCDISLLNLFLEKGANPNYIYYYGTKTYSVFSLLLKRNELNYETLKLLIEHGLNPNFKESYPTETTILYSLCCQEKPEFAAIKYLIDSGANINEYIFSNDYQTVITPIYFITHNFVTNIEIVKLFIEKGADLNGLSISPLFLLFRKYRSCLKPEEKNYFLDFIKFLIDNGANINKGYEDGEIKHSILFMFCKEKETNFNVIQILLSLNAKIDKETIEYVQNLKEGEKKNKLMDMFGIY